jgi:hypothetical protein
MAPTVITWSCTADLCAVSLVLLAHVSPVTGVDCHQVLKDAQHPMHLAPCLQVAHSVLVCLTAIEIALRPVLQRFGQSVGAHELLP